MDLQDAIESACYSLMYLEGTRKEIKEFKSKLNDLITVYNERREMKIYNHIK